MSDIEFKVYFTAVSTKHGGHLLAVGWVNGEKWRPVLKPDGNTSNFHFHLEETEDLGRVFVPFEISESFQPGMRSLNVNVEGKDIQVQIYEISGDGSGNNTAGVWVEEPHAA
jgi:hypothetical protein